MSDMENGADRINGLMAAMGRKETENVQLRARLAEYEGTAQETGDNTDPSDSQPAQEFEDGGMYTFEGGQFVPFEPPTPQRHNEARATTPKTEDPWELPPSKGFPV